MAKKDNTTLIGGIVLVLAVVIGFVAGYMIMPEKVVPAPAPEPVVKYVVNNTAVELLTAENTKLNDEVTKLESELSDLKSKYGDVISDRDLELKALSLVNEQLSNDTFITEVFEGLQNNYDVEVKEDVLSVVIYDSDSVEFDLDDDGNGIVSADLLVTFREGLDGDRHRLVIDDVEFTIEDDEVEGFNL